MSKRTPAPWRTYIIYDSGGPMVQVCDKDGWNIFRGRWGIDMKSEIEANAMLIAAAPELLEVCKALLEVRDIAEMWELMDKASAAIAKAEGGQDE